MPLALRVAALLAGVGFTGYHTLFGRYLGMNMLSDKSFYHVDELAYPHIQDILDEICEEAKDETKIMPSSELGSWQKAFTTSDGC